MKILLTANVQKDSKAKRYSKKVLDTLLKAQIENHIELNWNPKNIILVSNFDFEFMGVKSINTELNKFCLTGSKMFAIKWLFENYNFNGELIWAHDLDCWESVPVHLPLYDIGGNLTGIKYVGCAQYSNPKFNGGCIFWKESAKDIIDEIVKRLTETTERKEEPTINKVFKSKEYKDRITKLNHTYNVGCSGFSARMGKSLKPIRVCHFHPNSSHAWRIQNFDKAGKSISDRLEKLLKRYYPNRPNK